MANFSTVASIRNLPTSMTDATQIAMIGCGSMGGGMALLFAEVGVHVSLSDPFEEAMDAVVDKANKSNYNGKIQKYNGRAASSTLRLAHLY